ncbi:MAG: hypothetical protein HZA93_26440 [Verrucomicrobia bacterium]|nr:hypothetical protein [Verrucomicrobiota bacterium]
MVADSYILRCRELAFVMPSDEGLSAEDEREMVVEDFLGFIRHWRRQTFAERKIMREARHGPFLPIQTWDLLKGLGFQPDESVFSDIRPGLSFDFGNFKLSASAVLSRRFEEVVLFTGVLATARSLAEVQFEMPRQIESREKCAAWVAWNLDQAAGGGFDPANEVAWLKIGRANLGLLPWYFDRHAYETRPSCSMEREWARPLFKKLKLILAELPDDALVRFSFDGEVLKIRANQIVLAAPASGAPWQNSYVATRATFPMLPRRLTRDPVTFSIWNGHLEMANWRFGTVVPDVKEPPQRDGTV